MNRQDRKSIAEDTLRILERGEYVSQTGSQFVIADAVKRAITGTRVYTPDELAAMLNRQVEFTCDATQFEVHNETTLAAARRLVVERGLSSVLCLNIASAKNPGGGFLGGSQAQEESLARSSALYASLDAAPSYYKANRNCGTAMYTDHMILSPDIPVIRNDKGDLLDPPYEVAFVTAPAVNTGAVTENEPLGAQEIIPVMRRRIAFILALAATEGYRNLILGAWGCGVFRNDPSQISDLFAEHLLGEGTYARSFDRVVFAVLDRQNGNIINPFCNRFGHKAMD